MHHTSLPFLCLHSWPEMSGHLVTHVHMYITATFAHIYHGYIQTARRRVGFILALGTTPFSAVALLYLGAGYRTEQCGVREP